MFTLILHPSALDFDRTKPRGFRPWVPCTVCTRASLPDRYNLDQQKREYYYATAININETGGTKGSIFVSKSEIEERAGFCVYGWLEHRLTVFEPPLDFF